MDEPTSGKIIDEDKLLITMVEQDVQSGLDSASAFTLVKMLREITDSGVSVITVLHQPSERIFELLDDLVLMQSGEFPFIFFSLILLIRCRRSRICWSSGGSVSVPGFSRIRCSRKPYELCQVIRVHPGRSCRAGGKVCYQFRHKHLK